MTKLLSGLVLSAALLTTNQSASAQMGEFYFFQHQTSIKKTAEGCIVSILYPDQGPLSFEYKPVSKTVKISFQAKHTRAMTGDNQSLYFVLNATNPSPKATESATYNGSANGSVRVVNGHLEISMIVSNAVELVEFLARSYSISLGYKLSADGDSDSESYYLPDMRDVTDMLKKCAKTATASRK
jgi:hypothetical protein